MPEGDTIYRLAERLRPVLVGKPLTRTDFRVPSYATLDLSDRSIDEVVSVGKHLLMRAGDASIHSHLGMDGEWSSQPLGEKWRRPAHTARVVLETETHQVIGSLLKELDVVERAKEHDVVGHLGPDLLGPNWSAAEAIDRLREIPDAPIAVALLDQTRMAGLGNVYKNELCFLRGILPSTPVAEVDLPPLVDLARRTIWANRSRAARTFTGNTRKGSRFWVYGRAGRPCLRCGERIREGEIGAVETQLRVTQWCPHCQK